MKIERYIFSIVISLLMPVSCQVHELIDEDNTYTTFYATGESGTRTQLDGESWEDKTRLFWSPSDEIKVYCKGVESKFVSTNTEATGGTVEFVGSLPVRDRGEHPFWAIYPYSEDIKLDGNGVEVFLPSTQDAVAGNVQRGLMASVARSANNNLYFRHLFGVIRIGVYEDGIKKIVFKGNNGESVAGGMRAGMDEAGIPVITEIKNASQEITLLPPEGETFDTSETYFVVCLPGSFEKGYTIEFYREGLVSMKKIDTPVTLHRGHMVQLKDLYSGGIISSADYNGKTYSLRYKTHPETYSFQVKGQTVNYWVTIGDEVIEIPEVFEGTVWEQFARESPTRMGPVVAFDPENESFYFARPRWNVYGDMIDGVIYKYTPSGFEKKEIPFGNYPSFHFDDGQKRLELHSFGSLNNGICEHYILYHDSNDEWVKINYNDSSTEYDSSGYYAKTVSDIILFFHEPEPVETPVTVLNLGLSVNWGDRNLGAAAPERFGSYFAWGEKETKTIYSLDNYLFYDGEYNAWDHPARYVWMDHSFCVPIFTKYNHRDQKVILDQEDDAAHLLLGGDWRMPTPEEWQELIDNCSWEWTTVNGVEGQKGTSLKNGETIFLPAASLRVDDSLQKWDYDLVQYESYYDFGYYPSSYVDREWRSSSRNSWSYLVGVEGLSFDQNGLELRYGYRWRGVPIRPVHGGPIPIEEILLSDSEIELIPGDSAQLSASVVPLNATSQAILWSSSDDSVATVTQSGEVKGLSEGIATITVTALEGGVSANCQVVVKYWDSPEMVDLGLSVKWASYNIGATRPEDVGYYLAWGEIKPKEDFNSSTYRWRYNGDYYGLTKYCNNSLYGYNGFIDNKMVLDREDDAAYIYYGGKWRIPTEKEVIELCENTTFASATLNGVVGYWLTSTINGNRVFFPSTGFMDYDELRESEYGFYWSSSLSDDSSTTASYLSLYTYQACNTFFRELGLPVRAVYGDPVAGGNEDITPGGDINM